MTISTANANKTHLLMMADILSGFISVRCMLGVSETINLQITSSEFDYIQKEAPQKRKALNFFHHVCFTHTDRHLFCQRCATLLKLPLPFLGDRKICQA